MRLLVIRHAVAVPRGTPGIEDDARPLTRQGVERFRQVARGLARFVARPDVLLTSPRLRARATADLAARAWRRVTPTLEPALAADDAAPALDALAKWPADATVALVGHEPQLSGLLAALVGGADPDRLALPKGGAALVETDGLPVEGARLVWFLPPRLLRRVRRGWGGRRNGDGAATDR
jgi:phosphohistidine phosphatase